MNRRAAKNAEESAEGLGITFLPVFFLCGVLCGLGASVVQKDELNRRGAGDAEEFAEGEFITRIIPLLRRTELKFNNRPSGFLLSLR